MGIAIAVAAIVLDRSCSQIGLDGSYFYPELILVKAKGYIDSRREEI